ncbi:hypothetical protein KAR91_02655, partial [Candidatus Pacearchaeota archaeon]|nr:hypothetical protein [Candidatus Pacearchaeota archaeon]
MSFIEDSGTGNEILAKGYHSGYTQRTTVGRPREKNEGSMPAFVNRFNSLVVVDDMLSVRYQKLMKSKMLHWAEKLGLLMNNDHYVNEPIALRYNVLIFIGAFILSLTPFALLALPLLVINIQYILTQAVIAGGIKLVTDNMGVKRGLLYYMQRYWSLVFTYLPLMAIGNKKITEGLLEGKTGIFTRGVKDTAYPVLGIRELYHTFRPSVRWGILLLALLLIAPYHPYAVVAQLFFHVFPVAFIFGPFTKNGRSMPKVAGTVFGSMWLALLIYLVWPFSIPAITTTIMIAVYSSAIIFLAARGEKYSKGIVFGLGAIVYALAWDIPANIFFKMIGVKKTDDANDPTGLPMTLPIKLFNKAKDKLKSSQKTDNARPLPEKAMPSRVEIDSEIRSKVKRFGKDRFGVINTKSVEVQSVISDFELAGDHAMIEYISRKGLIRAGPLEGFLATVHFDVDGLFGEKGREIILLSDSYSVYNTSLEKSRSISHEIGALADFNLSHEENEDRDLRLKVTISLQNLLKRPLNVENMARLFDLIEEINGLDERGRVNIPFTYYNHILSTYLLNEKFMTLGVWRVIQNDPAREL